MLTVWKYQLGRSLGFEIEIPKGAILLKADSFEGIACLWALVSTTAEKEKRKFEILNTGDRLDRPDSKRYIDTFIQGAYVYHLFEIVTI